MARLRLLTLNVHNPRSADSLERVGSFLDASGAEVLALTECGRDAYGKLSGTLGCAGGAYAPAPYWGNAILTRTLPASSLGAVWLGDGLASETRSAAAADLELGGGRLRVVATHLDHMSENDRLVQARQLLADARVALTGAVLMGDLNALRRPDRNEAGWRQVAAERRAAGLDPPDFRLLDHLIEREGFRDSAAAGDPASPTSRFGTRVDYVLLGPACPAQLVPDSYQVLPALDEGVTDHNAVYVEVEVR